MNINYNFWSEPVKITNPTSMKFQDVTMQHILLIVFTVSDVRWFRLSSIK